MLKDYNYKGSDDSLLQALGFVCSEIEEKDIAAFKEMGFSAPDIWIVDIFGYINEDNLEKFVYEFAETLEEIQNTKFESKEEKNNFIIGKLIGEITCNSNDKSLDMIEIFNEYKNGGLIPYFCPIELFEDIDEEELDQMLIDLIEYYLED